jgi:hypothetical protein
MPALTDGAIVTSVLRPEALAIRGAFHPRPEDAVPGFPDNADVGTLVLLGWTGGHNGRRSRPLRKLSMGSLIRSIAGRGD